MTPLFVAVIGLALGLRLWGIQFGLPYDLTYDEIHEILRAFKLGAGEYDWEGFGKGGLYYLLFVEYGFLYIIWWMSGRIADAREFALLYLQDPFAFYLAGRLTVAVMGTLTCWVILQIGRRVYDAWVGLGAALIGATAYYHAVWSHYVNVDIGMALAVWASILAYLQYEAQNKFRWLLVAAALGGIAIAFKLPGAIALLLLLAAVASHVEKWRNPRLMLRQAGWVVLIVLLTLTAVAPEWLMGLRLMPKAFSQLLGDSAPYVRGPAGEAYAAQYAVTVGLGEQRLGYLTILLQDYNIVLTLSALLGIGWGVWRRHRWDLMWSGLIVVFIGIMSIADRIESDRYLLPVMPALWLLSSRGILAVCRRRPWAAAMGIACVVAVPLAALVYQNYMWTKPDTRLLAKTWIESHVPSGAKILMDGMQYRFVQSPPLNPNQVAVDRRIAQAGEARRLSRGVSQRTLALYAEAAGRAKGPVYDLYSTGWGLEVEALAYYVQACFDYIVISSYSAEKYEQESLRQRFPNSARFYEQLPTDPRFRLVYTAAPRRWQRQGPVITVYQVLATCNASQDKAAALRQG